MWVNWLFHKELGNFICSCNSILRRLQPFYFGYLLFISQLLCVHRTLSSEWESWARLAGAFNWTRKAAFLQSQGEKSWDFSGQILIAQAWPHDNLSIGKGKTAVEKCCYLRKGKCHEMERTENWGDKWNECPLYPKSTVFIHSGHMNWALSLCLALGWALRKLRCVKHTAQCLSSYLVSRFYKLASALRMQADMC